MFLLYFILSNLFFSNQTPLSSNVICQNILNYRNKNVDSSKSLIECIHQTKPGGIINIPPGHYKIMNKIHIDRSVFIQSMYFDGKPACSPRLEANCAVLEVGSLPASSSFLGGMPIEIEENNVSLHSLIIEGGGNRSKDWEKRICLDESIRPLAGGIRVKGNNFHMTNVVLRNFSCYTALEVTAGVKGLSVKDSLIGPNGQHDIRMMWADGITVHDAADAVIQNNAFLDNTDVQLIFGGCTGCIVSKNQFRHSSSFRHASFAELMIHAWSGTSGNFSGSLISQNDIDCGQSKRCGYGIMVGGEPWYPAKTFGGTVSANKVSNAQLGINVDQLTGVMTIQDNSVTMSGGIANSDCGRKNWPAINVSRQSRRFLTTDIRNPGAIATKGCLLNKYEH